MESRQIQTFGGLHITMLVGLRISLRSKEGLLLADRHACARSLLLIPIKVHQLGRRSEWMSPTAWMSSQTS